LSAYSSARTYPARIGVSSHSFRPTWICSWNAGRSGEPGNPDILWFQAGTTGKLALLDVGYTHEPTDILGNSRFVDGNGDGKVAWDIGAYVNKGNQGKGIHRHLTGFGESHFRYLSSHF